jgi:hypothetical protein
MGFQNLAQFFSFQLRQQRKTVGLRMGWSAGTRI